MDSDDDDVFPFSQISTQTINELKDENIGLDIDGYIEAYDIGSFDSFSQSVLEREIAKEYENDKIEANSVYSIEEMENMQNKIHLELIAKDLNITEADLKNSLADPVDTMEMFNIDGPFQISESEPILKIVDIEDEACENNPPPPKIARFQLCNEDLSQRALARTVIPKSTQCKASWGIRTFNDWCEWTKIKMPPLNHMIPKQLDEYLSRFIKEVRMQKDGERYPPNTLHQLITSIQKGLQLEGIQIQLLNNKELPRLTLALESEMQKSAKIGLGMKTRKADPITIDQEQSLWDEGVLGRGTPTSLFNAIFFGIGISFGLRSGQEHRDLSQENFSIGVKDGKRYVA